MKKTLIAVAAAAALTTSAFAEITFGAWLRVLAAPVASDGDETVTAMGNSWGYGARVARLNVNAVAEDGRAGFDMGIYNDLNDGLSTGDQWSIWTKPVEQVKLSFGKYDNNTLRGDLCYGSWNWLRPTSSWIAEDEGLLMSGKANDGVKIEVTPIDGLYILAMAPINSTAKKAEDVYKKLQAGFAYNIDGVGKIKAQYIGKGKGEVKATETTPKVEGNSNCDIEAAFDLAAVENLYVGVGFKYANIKDGDKIAKDQQKMKIALAASYQVSDELKLSCRRP